MCPAEPHNSYSETTECLNDLSHSETTKCLYDCRLTLLYLYGFSDCRQSLETPQTGPQDGRHSGSTPSPKTPLQTEETEHGQRDDSNFERTDSDDSAATKDEPNLMTTRSTLSCATSRPQPVSELQGLLGVSLGGIATEVVSVPFDSLPVRF